MQEAKCPSCGEVFLCPCDACLKLRPSVWKWHEDNERVVCKCGAIIDLNDLLPKL